MIDSPEIVRQIESSPLFRDVSREALASILDQQNLLSLKPGDRLLSPDRINEHVYIVLSGRLSVQMTPSRTEKPIALLNPGECVGEMSVLADHLVSAYVVAISDCQLLAIDYAAFWGLLDGSNKAARNMLNILVHRIRMGNELVADSLMRRDVVPEKNLIDSLTGLYNQHGIESKFERLLRRALAGGQGLCLVMLEPDEVASDKGTGIGSDQALRAIAQTMLTFLRPDDHAARLIGRKFAVLLYGISLDDAEATARRLRTALSNLSIRLPDGSMLPPLTLSAAVSQACADDTWGALLFRTDKLLQSAITAGGDRLARD